MLLLQVRLRHRIELLIALHFLPVVILFSIILETVATVVMVWAWGALGDEICSLPWRHHRESRVNIVQIFIALLVLVW